MNNEQIEKVLEQLTGIVTTLTTEVSQLKANPEKKEDTREGEASQEEIDKLFNDIRI